MKYENGAYVLSTGRSVGHAGNGILGISPDGVPELHSGYDNYEEQDFTFSERREIADAMIVAWNLWASGACEAIDVHTDGERIKEVTCGKPATKKYSDSLYCADCVRHMLESEDFQESDLEDIS